MQNRYVKVKDYPHHIKDVDTGAILNIDNKALDMYRKKREQNQFVQNLGQRMDSVESSLNEINNALKILLERDK